MGFNTLKGQIFDLVYQTDDSIYFVKYTAYNHRYSGLQLHHTQQCCESVYIESVVGDLADISGNPIVQAEDVTSKYKDARDDWVFYKLRTLKGFVTIRFVQEYSEYYSTEVSLSEIHEDYFNKKQVKILDKMRDKPKNPIDYTPRV